jgi:hypothetical protein
LVAEHHEGAKPALLVVPFTQHQHIKSTTKGYYIVYIAIPILKDAVKQRQADIQEWNHPPIFQFSVENGFQNISPRVKKAPLQLRGRQTVWKCSLCHKPICKQHPTQNCWLIAHQAILPKKKK